jgi:hypothetical protein
MQQKCPRRPGTIINPPRWPGRPQRLQDPSLLEMKEGMTCSRRFNTSKFVFMIRFLH